MELIPVNSQKLKIILTKEDMTSFDITNEDLDYSSAKTRKALGNILEKAKNETGFDTANNRLYIQVFPSVDGGCELFLTRRAKLLPEPESSECTYLKRKNNNAAVSYKNEYGKYIAKTHDIEDIIKLCVRLKKEGFNRYSSLYSLEDYFILILDFKQKLPMFNKYTKNDDEIFCFSFICDYCSVRYADELPTAYINEHGKLIIKDNAVETIFESFGDNSYEQHGF